MLLGSFSVALPWVLLALALLVFLPRRSTWPWRALALALLVVALAQPQLDRPGRTSAVLVDVSESLGDNALEALEGFDFSALPRPPAVFLFAGDTTRASRPVTSVPDFLTRSQTDLARALQVVHAAGAGRALLLSDGAQSAGDVLMALPDIPVDTYRVPSRDNVRLVSLLAPEEVGPGQTVQVVAVVETDRPAEVTLRPSVGDSELEPIRLSVPAGRTPFPFQFTVEETSNLEIAASLSADFTQPSADDSQSIVLSVSDEARLLVIGDPAVSELLETQGLNVVRGTPADVTGSLPYSAIVLRQGANQFTPGQLELLETFVRNGGGLLMTGGPESFGLGAWYRTPVEEVLPVHTDLRTDVELPLVAMVIVLDRSQSMSSGSPQKLELAKEGAIAVVELAYEQDRLGLVAFSNEAEWVFDLRPATERGKRVMIDAILRLETAGGTVLEPAYQEAIRSLAQSEAAIKHIIVLTDGRLSDGAGPFGNGSTTDFGLIAQTALARGITTSTIAIGEGADFARLAQIALAGGGRYYEALDVSTLPRIFSNEAFTATRSLLRDEPLAPTPHPHPLAPELSAPPPLEAYIASGLKDEGEMILEGQNGEPVLAVSRQGLGRSAALTTDLNAWAGDFGGWPELPGLLGTVVRWLQTAPAEYTATVSPAGARLRVVVDAVRNGEYIDNQRLTARYSGADTVLEQVAPGRYEGSLEAPAIGGTLLVVSGNEIVARADVRSPNAEFETREGAALLAEIAERTGGQVISAPGPYAPLAAPEPTPLWPYFAAAGLVVFLLELIVRRFTPDRPLAAATD